jgi:hypothetical protein
MLSQQERKKEVRCDMFFLCWWRPQFQALAASAACGPISVRVTVIPPVIKAAMIASIFLNLSCLPP